MKIWIDDLRPAPIGYYWIKSVNEAIAAIELIESFSVYFPSSGETRRATVELLDLDHDAGDFACDGGDYIKILDWMEETGRSYPIRFHTANPVGRQNMLAICQKNNWKVIY